jgi:SAM-dependent methyltransferase
MNILTIIACNISKFSRDKRSNIFRNIFTINKNTRILDLGSEDGSNINNVLNETNINIKNIYIADINLDKLKEGNKKYGYQFIHIHEDKNLPFEDKHFDIIFCSSVIEHVTIPKEDVWKIRSSQEFKEKSFQRQQSFAEEIKRIGKQYFIQTPYKYFPIESHTWLPLVGFLPRPLLLSILRLTNRIWVKKTTPDWNLLNRKQLKILFSDAEIRDEKILGLTKSIMATKKLI